MCLFALISVHFFFKHQCSNHKEEEEEEERTKEESTLATDAWQEHKRVKSRIAGKTTKKKE
jgi:hypothetical protein